MFKKNSVKKVIFSMLFLFSIMVFSQDADNKSSLAIYSPFKYQALEKIPENVRNEMDLENIIVQNVIEYIRKKGFIKNVIEVKDDENVEAAMFLKASIVEVNPGNGAGRYFAGLFGAGVSYIVLDVELLDAAKKSLKKEQIVQKGTKAGGFGATFSNKGNLMTAVQALSRTLENMVRNAGSFGNDQNFQTMLASGSLKDIRLACQKISKSQVLLKDESVLDAVEKAIEWYLSKLNDPTVLKDRYGVDAIAWCCITLSKSKNAKYLPVLNKVVNSSAKKKIKKHAKKAVKVIESQK